MREIRTYIDAVLVAGEELALDARASGHIARVLRRRAGDRITLFDGRGTEAEAELVATERRGPCRVRIETVAAVDRESPLHIELIQAVARGDKMDWVVQKATELGVGTIRPVFTQRSEVRIASAAAERKQQRWHDIAISACEQSGRNWLPEMLAPLPLAELNTDAALRLMLDLEGATALTDVLSRRSEQQAGPRIALAIGPEGGFGDDDRSTLHKAGFVAATLGPRVLRTETAGLAAIAVLQYVLGDLGAEAGLDSDRKSSAI